MKKEPKPAAKSATVNEMSKLLEYDRRTIGKIVSKMKPVDWLGEYARYDVAEVAKALEKRVRAKADLTPKQQAELRKINLQSQRIEFETDVLRGKYVDRQAMASDLVTLASGVKALLRQKLETEYPGLLDGLDPAQRAQLKQLGKDLVDRICLDMQRLAAKWKTQ